MLFLRDEIALDEVSQDGFVSFVKQRPDAGSLDDLERTCLTGGDGAGQLCAPILEALGCALVNNPRIRGCTLAPGALGVLNLLLCFLFHRACHFVLEHALDEIRPVIILVGLGMGRGVYLTAKLGRPVGKELDQSRSCMPGLSRVRLWRHGGVVRGRGAALDEPVSW
jgi:hypothetical protein